MKNWRYKIKIRHLFTENEDYKSVQESMNKIADVLEKEFCFARFSVKKFREIPKEDDIIKPIDYANKLLDMMWDFADANDIWIDFDEKVRALDESSVGGETFAEHLESIKKD